MPDDLERERALTALSKVVAFASTSVCRRRTLLDYFGETYPHPNCNTCDICLGTRETVDATLQAQMVLSAIVRTEERFGATHIVDILTGSQNKKILDFGHDRLKTYGVGKTHDKKYWRQLINELLAQQVIQKSEGLYPTLFLLPKAVTILKHQEPFSTVLLLEKKKGQLLPKKSEPDSDSPLFELLRSLRKQIADEQGIPPYVVFSDRTLHDMAANLPRTAEAMLTVSGVGEVKLQRYGKQFLRIIDRYASSPDPV
jgi:ATP-dependent DNA helicase RecQ